MLPWLILVAYAHIFLLYQLVYLSILYVLFVRYNSVGSKLQVAGIIVLPSSSTRSCNATSEKQYTTVCAKVGHIEECKLLRINQPARNRIEPDFMARTITQLIYIIHPVCFIPLVSWILDLNRPTRYVITAPKLRSARMSLRRVGQDVGNSATLLSFRHVVSFVMLCSFVPPSFNLYFGLLVDLYMYLIFACISY